jgi:hypothetical protein
MPWPIDRKLAMHVALRACSRALPNDGNKMAISRAMIEITTSSSINVNAFSLLKSIVKASSITSCCYFSRSDNYISLFLLIVYVAILNYISIAT